MERMDWKGEGPVVDDVDADIDAEGDEGRVSSFPLGVDASLVSSGDFAVDCSAAFDGPAAASPENFSISFCA